MASALDPERLATYCGPLAVALAVLGILGAVALSPSFSWTASALSDLGARGEPTAPLFNGGLVAAGLVGLVFTWRVWTAAANHLQRVGVAVLAVALVAMAFVGVFPLPAPEHGPVSVTFFVTFTYGLLVYGTGDVLAGTVRRGLLTIWLGAAHPTAWLLWVHSDVEGIALPELAGAALLATWVLLTFRRLLDEPAGQSSRPVSPSSRVK